VQTALRNAYLRAAVRREPRKGSSRSRSWILPGSRQCRLGGSTVSSLSSVSRKMPPTATQAASNQDSRRDGACCNVAGVPCHCRRAIKLGDSGRSHDRTVDIFHV
ncbi:hypothetical protein MTO96_047364, partial [Rhipicephalus appendiculatus]